VCAIEAKRGKLKVVRKADGFQEHFALSFPAAFTIHQSAAEPRDIDLAGLQSAFQEREISELSLEDIGISPEQVGDAGSPTRVLSLSRIDRGRRCEFLTGSAEEQVNELSKRLLETGMIV
jgi:electron transfer flavoprotein beta subunit